MESIKLRIVFAVVGLVALLGATAFFLTEQIIAPSQGQWPYLAVIVVAWAYAIPNIIKLCRMIAEHVAVENRRRFEMGDDGQVQDKQKTELKVRQKYLAVGLQLVTVGGSLQILAGNVHTFIPQMIVRATAILMCIVGIVILVRGITKTKKAAVSKGN